MKNVEIIQSQIEARTAAKPSNILQRPGQTHYDGNRSAKYERSCWLPSDDPLFSAELETIVTVTVEEMKSTAAKLFRVCIRDDIRCREELLTEQVFFCVVWE